MMDRKELNELKEEYKSLTDKLKELSEDELKEVTGGEIGEWQNVEHSGLDVKNQGKYSVYYGTDTPSDERLKN